MTNKEFFIDSVLSEVKGTAALIRAVPQDNWSYTHHPRQRTAKQMIGHLVPHIDDVIELVTEGTMNHRWQVDFASPEAAAAHFESSCKALAEKTALVDDKNWYEQITPLIINGNKAYEMPMFRMAWMMYTDMIHHRGQLSTYIRPMGGTMVPVYGPTWEMTEGKAASNN